MKATLDGKEVYPEAILLQLGRELATRSDNEHVGSGKGGDAAKLFFFLTNTMKVGSNQGNSVEFLKKDDAVFMTMPSDRLHFQMSEIRAAFDEFFENHSAIKDITFEQLTNVSFLKDNVDKSNNILLLIKAVEDAKIVQKWLDLKEPARHEISEVLGREIKECEHAFLKEYNLPLNYFDKMENKTYDNTVNKALRNHPVWGVKIDAVSKRIDDIMKALIGPNELEKLNTILSCPTPIALLSIRVIIGIERVVKFQLDEMVNLSKIN